MHNKIETKDETVKGTNSLMDINGKIYQLVLYEANTCHLNLGHINEKKYHLVRSIEFYSKQIYHSHND